MLYIQNTCTDVYFNLAAEEYLIKKFSEDIFMLYQNEPSVIIGRFQDINAEVNSNFVKENDILIARRISGGGAVYHDAGNFNLVFIENTINPDFNIYANRIMSFLENLKIPTKTDERHGITFNGLKISGSAQYIFKNRIMYHASLLYSSDLETLTTALDVQPAETRNVLRRSVKSVKSPVTNLSNHLEDSIETIDFGEIIFRYFSCSKTSGNNTYRFNKKDINDINQLKINKYANPQWIFNGTS